MFSALFKNEARLQGRTLLAFTGIAAATLLGSIVMVLIHTPVVSSLGLMMGVIAVFALAGGIPIYLLVRYYQSMYGREGYFTHVVPARASTLYWAKFLWAFTISLLSLVIAALLGLALFLAQMSSTGTSVGRSWSMIIGVVSQAPGRIVALILILILVEVVLYLAQFGWIVSFGMEDRFRSLGLGGPVIVWFINYITIQILSLAAIFLIPIGYSMQNGSLVFQSMLSTFSEMTTEAEPIVMPLGFVVVLVGLIPVYIVWTVNSIKNHTSLR